MQGLLFVCIVAVVLGANAEVEKQSLRYKRHDNSHFCCEVEMPVSFLVRSRTKVAYKQKRTVIKVGSEACGLYKMCPIYKAVYSQEPEYYVAYYNVPKQEPCPSDKVSCCPGYIEKADHCLTMEELISQGVTIQDLIRLKLGPFKESGEKRTATTEKPVQETATPSVTEEPTEEDATTKPEETEVVTEIEEELSTAKPDVIKEKEHPVTEELIATAPKSIPPTTVQPEKPKVHEKVTQAPATELPQETSTLSEEDQKIFNLLAELNLVKKEKVEKTTTSPEKFTEVQSTEQPQVTLSAEDQAVFDLLKKFDLIAQENAIQK